MKCNYCKSENTKLAGGCYCCYVCLDCDKGFRLGVKLIEVPISGYWERVETVSFDADKSPFWIIY